MKKIITCLFCIVSTCLFSQSGFMKMYDFGDETYFNNVILDGERIIIGGALWDEDLQQLVSLILEIDTLGQVLNTSTYADTMDSHLTFFSSSELLKTSNDNYILTGNVLNRGSDFILQYDQNLNPVSFWELSFDDTILFSRPYRLIEVDNGFLLFSWRQIFNYKYDVFITKIDFEGEVVWEKTYGELELDEAIGSVYQLDDNTFVIGSAKSDFTSPYHEVADWTQSWIFAVDSLGEMKWEWIGEKYEGALVRDVYATDDGGWVFATRKIVVFDQWNFGGIPMIVKRDADWNLVWEQRVGESYATPNAIFSLKPTPDGGWHGAGRWILPTPIYGWSSEYVWRAGFQIRLTEAGDSLWVRSDTMPLGDNSVYLSEFAGVVVLPSGSSIAVGKFGSDEYSQSFGWVVKTDRNGCLKEDCITTSIVEVPVAVSPFQVYPNPAGNEVTFRLRQADKSAVSISVSDLHGRQIWSGKVPPFANQLQWQIPDNLNGVYFYQFEKEGQLLDTGRLIIQ